MIEYSFTFIGLIMYNFIIGLICFFIGYFANKKNKFGKSFSINILVSLLCISLIFISFYFISELFIHNTKINHKWCDYDSCSQETYKWNYNGLSCFDSNNPDCREFLMLWNACQEYKNKIGVC